MLSQAGLIYSLCSSSDNRIFVYEVKGLRQNDQTDRNTYPVRNSSNTFMQVPLSRMNEAMRRIHQLGGEIVSIKPLSAVSASTKPAKE